MVNTPLRISLIVLSAVVVIAGVCAILAIRSPTNQPLDEEMLVVSDFDTLPPNGGEPAAVVKTILANITSDEVYSEIVIDYPFEGSIFPPEIVAPRFLWHDDAEGVGLWLVDVALDGGLRHIYALTAGRLPERQIDPNAVSKANEDYRPTDYQLSAKAWTPDGPTWELIKANCVEKPATVAITGISGGGLRAVSRAAVRIMTSKDPVGAPIFYRDVPLMPSETSKGEIKPLAKGALPLISWRLRDISKDSAPVVLRNMPTCGNCHSFSRDGKVLGMDMDGPRGDKGAYAITPVKKDMVITAEDIISWNSYEGAIKGQKTFGLFSQVSPDGKRVISTLNESVFVANYPEFRFLQSFYPTRGILVVYDKSTKQMNPLPGADDVNYVHANGCWSPSGREIVFSRARAKDKYEGDNMPTHVGDPNETFIQYDLHVMPFNDGRGGTPRPLQGASNNGVSNSFARYSPDGKWIVFVQAEKGQLMRPDSKLYIIPAGGGRARLMSCNLPVMNSWHSWSPNSRWLVFASKGFTPFTQMFLTHIDEEGNDSPAVRIPNSTADNRAVNIPEFLYNSPDAIASINTPTQESYRHFSKAQELRDAGRYAEALVELERSLHLNPFYAAAHNDKGSILFRTGKTDQAEACFNKAIELDPELGMVYCNLGSVRQLQGKIDQAVELYVRGLELDPALANARFNYANILKMQGNLDEAIVHYRMALIIQPSLGEAHCNLGMALQQKGMTEQAIQSYQKALEVDPNRAEAHYNLGLAFESQGRLNDAIDSFSRVIELQGGYAGAHYRLGHVLQLKGDIDGAIVEYREALELDPDYARAHYSLGVVMAAKGQVDRAIEYLKRSVELMPDNPDAQANLALVLHAKGQYESSIEHFSEALRIKPDYPRARIGLADALFRQGELLRAAEECRVILRTRPDDITTLNLLAWIYATGDGEVADGPKAVELAEKACRLTGQKVPEMLDTLAAAYATAGRFSEAVATAEKAVELASRAGNTSLANSIRRILGIYRRGERYVQPQRTPK